MKRSFVLAVAVLVVAALAAFAEMARIRIVNAGGAALELDDGSVLVPGSSHIEYVPAGYSGTICGAPYPALAPGELYLLRVAPERVAKAKPAPVAPAVEPAAEPEPAPAAVPAPSRPASQAETRPPEPAPVAVTEPASAVKPVARPVDETGTPDPAPQTPAIAPPAMPQVPDGMVLVPAGENTGVDPEYGPYSLISPGFFMDRSEITLAQWHEVREWAEEHGYRFDHEGNGKGDNHPVHTISWYDCAKWCNARSEMEGLVPVYYHRNAVFREAIVNGLESPDVFSYEECGGYRLPSRDQWDIAARGGASSTIFPWGNVITRENANVIARRGMASSYMENVSVGDFSKDPEAEYDTRFRLGGTPYTCSAGTFPPNGYGLTEMQGNVAEWLNDDNLWGQPHFEALCYGGAWDMPGEGCSLGSGVAKSRNSAHYDTGFRTVRPIPGIELPFELPSGEFPEAKHPEAEKRLTDSLGARDKYTQDGWKRRNPYHDTMVKTIEDRKRMRMACGVWEKRPALPPSPESVTANLRMGGGGGAASLESGGGVASTSGIADSVSGLREGGPRRPPAGNGAGADHGFKLRRVPARQADLMVFLQKGEATMTPNDNFSYGFMDFRLKNNTGRRIVRCEMEIGFSVGGLQTISFADIPAGGVGKSDDTFAMIGANINGNLTKEPFLFPALVFVDDGAGNIVDLYESGVSVGFLSE